MSDTTDALIVKKEGSLGSSDQVTWQETRVFSGKTSGMVSNLDKHQFTRPQASIRQPVIRNRELDDPCLSGLAITIYYDAIYFKQEKTE